MRHVRVRGCEFEEAGLAVPCTWWLRSQSRTQLATARIVSGVAAVSGAFWFVQRVLSL
jgi:hypothetical protein